MFLYRISNPTMKETDAINPEYVLAIASLMAPAHPPILEKPPPFGTNSLIY